MSCDTPEFIIKLMKIPARSAPAAHLPGGPGNQGAAFSWLPIFARPQCRLPSLQDG